MRRANINFKNMRAGKKFKSFMCNSHFKTKRKMILRHQWRLLLLLKILDVKLFRKCNHIVYLKKRK